MRVFSASGVRPDHDSSKAALDAADAVGRWDVDVDRQVVTADAMVAFLFGFTPEQAEEGIAFEAFNHGVHPDDRAYAMERIEQCVRHGGWFITEHRVSSADGQTRRILARGRFDKNEAGVVRSGSGIVVDITHSQDGEDPLFITRAGQATTSLEQATDLILSSHTALKAAGEPRALVLVEKLLMELGRSIARAQARDRLNHLH